MSIDTVRAELRRLGAGRLLKMAINQKESRYGLKYSFAYLSGGQRVIGYDNAEGKGDHGHYKGREYPCRFQNLEKLWKDFRGDIQRFKEERS
jgi:hypothetical protein